MWSGSPAIRRQQTQDERDGTPLHNLEQHVEAPTESPEADSTRVPSEAGAERPQSGLWGERDVGGPVDPEQAREDFEVLRRELTGISRQQTQQSLKSKKSVKSLAAKSTRSLQKVSSRDSTHRTQTRATVLSKETDGTDYDKEAAEEVEEDFALDDFMREGHFEKRVEGHSAKRIGVVYKDLRVKGVGVAATFVKTLPDAVLGTFGPDLYRLLSRFLPFLRFGKFYSSLELF